MQLTMKLRVVGGVKITVIINKLILDADLLEYGLGFIIPVNSSRNSISSKSQNHNKKPTGNQWLKLIVSFLPSIEIVIKDVDVTVSGLSLKIDQIQLELSISQKYVLDVNLSELNVSTATSAVSAISDRYKLFKLTSLKIAASYTENASTSSDPTNQINQLECALVVDDIYCTLSTQSNEVLISFLSQLSSNLRPSVEFIRANSKEKYVDLVTRLDRIDEYYLRSPVTQLVDVDVDDETVFFPTRKDSTSTEVKQNEAKSTPTLVINASCSMKHVFVVFHRVPLERETGDSDESISTIDVFAIQSICVAYNARLCSTGNTMLTASVEDFLECSLLENEFNNAEWRSHLHSQVQTSIIRTSPSKWISVSFNSHIDTENGPQTKVECSIAPFILQLHTHAIATVLSLQSELGYLFSSQSKWAKLRTLSSAETAVSKDINRPTSKSNMVFNIEIKAVELRLLTMLHGEVDSSPICVEKSEAEKSSSLVIKLNNIDVSGSSQHGLDVLIQHVCVATALGPMSSVRNTTTHEKDYLQVNNIRIYSMLQNDEASRLRYDIPISTETVVSEQWIDSRLNHSNSDASSMTTSMSVQSVSATPSQYDIVTLSTVLGTLKGAKDTYNPLPNYVQGANNPYVIRPMSACTAISRGMDIKIQSISVDLIWLIEAPSSSIHLIVENERVDNANRIVYSVLDGICLDINSKSLGCYYSNMNVYLTNNNPNNSVNIKRSVYTDGEIVHTMSVLSLAFEVFDRAIESSVGFSHNKTLVFSSKSLLTTQHTSCSAFLSLGYSSNYSLLTLPEIIGHIDVIQITHLLWFIRSFTASDSIAAFKLRSVLYPGFTEYNQNNELLQFKNPTSSILSAPNKISSTSIVFLRLNFYHTLEAVFTLSMHNVEVNSMSFGPLVSQLAVNLTSLKLFEFTSKKAHHTCLVGDMQPSPGKDQDSSSIPNRIEMHMTTCFDECSLLEFHAEYLRVLYLQRPTLTLVCFIRDFLIADIMTALRSKYNTITSTLAESNSLLYVQRRGMFRLGTVIHKTEIHLPGNSCSTDAISIMFKNANIFKTSEEISAQDPQYTKGPYVSKNIWIGEIANSRKVIQYYFNKNNRSVTSPDAIKWTLPLYVASDLMAPPAITIRGTNKLILDIGLYDGTFCSWCNSNSVCEGINITCTFTMFPAARLEGELYERELEAIGIELMESCRNTMIVNVWTSDLDWTLAQGQYFGIVNLIQQNFSELQEVVVDPYILPVPKIVEINADKVYGKYSMEVGLPIISTIPIHISEGRILAINNSPDYYTLFTTPLVNNYTMENLNADLVNAEADLNQFEDSIPGHSYHFHYRNKLFSRLFTQSAAQGINKKDYGLNRHLSTILNNNLTFSAPSVAECDAVFNNTSLASSVLCIYFTALEIDFFRRHYGGGNGIEVSAISFVIVGTGSNPDNDDNESNDNERDLDDVSVERVIFAPKSFDILNSGRGTRLRDKRSRSRMYSKGTPQQMRSNSSGKSPKGATALTEGVQTTDSTTSVERPCIRYTQQGVGNLRRCIVEIEESVAVAHIVKILDVIAFFLKPINVISERNLALISRNDENGPYDFKAALDVEVHLKNTVMCLPNIAHREGASGMCIHLNFVYQHSWRGFLICGPGKIAYTIDADIMSIYIAPLHEIYSSQIQSLVDACTVNFSMGFTILPEEQYLEANLAMLTPWMTFPEWVRKPNRLNRPSATRLLSIKMYPTEIHDENEFHFHTAENTADDIVTVPTPSPPSDEIVTAKDSSQVEVKDVDSVSDEDEVEKEEVEADEIDTPILKFRLSLKDVSFIVVAIQQLKQSLAKRVLPKTGDQDPYYEILQQISDVDHLPMLMYYLVHIVRTEAWKPDNKELLVDMCDYEIIMRNNTYNLNILKLDLSELCLIYNRSPERLHMASGLSVAGWAYNDLCEDWEPIIEPINMRAIGATDASKNSQSFSVTRASRIKIEVDTDPLELNASQTTLVNLIRKLSLADVVTTSSIHLPPYKVVNDLGVHVKFTIGMGGGIITDNEIANGKFLPIEVNQLTEALNNYKRRRQYNSVSRGSIVSSRNAKLDTSLTTAEREYKMGISFANFSDYYRSSCPVPIDKEGIYPFEMQVIHEVVVPEYATGTVIPQSNSKATNGGQGSDAVEKPRGRILSTISRRISSQGQSTDASTLAMQLTSESVSTTDSALTPRNGATVESSSEVPNSENTTGAPAAPHVVKFVHETPMAILDMRVKADGVRELLLRSILSLKNQTSRVFYVSIHLYGTSTEVTLLPGKEWNVPVRFANPKSTLYFRLDERGEWIEGLPSFQYLITSGYWGSPNRLRAELCSCPTSVAPDNSDIDWLVLLKPEARDHKVIQQSGAKTFIPVRYPSKEVHRGSRNAPQLPVGDNVMESIDGMLQIEDIYNIGTALKSRGAQPLCIQFLAPLQLCNLLSQPILYRLADASGLITAEGVLLPGEIVDVHSLLKLFTSKIFISIRMLNYCWSKWTVIFGRSNPYSMTEKAVDITLTSMDFMYQSKELTLPPLDISMLTKEHLVRFTCPVLISNRTGLQLDFCESSAPDSFIPQRSRNAMEKFIPLNNLSQSTTQLKLNTVTPKRSNLILEEADGYETDNDLEGKDEEGDSDDEHDDIVEHEGNDMRQTFSANDNDDTIRKLSTGLDEFDVDVDLAINTVRSGSSPGQFMRRVSGIDSDDEISHTVTADECENISAGLQLTKPPLSVPKQVRVVDKPTSSLRSGKIVNLTVHMPHDHLRKIDVVASSEWTLSDVFNQLKKHLSISADYQLENFYLFFTWENGKQGPRKVDNALIVDSDVVDVLTTVTAEGENVTQSILSIVETVVPDVKEKKSISSRMPSLLRSSSKTGSSFSTSSSTTSSAVSSSDNDVQVPLPMSFDMLVDCNVPLTMDTKIETLKCLRLRLCHESEHSIYQQVKRIKTEAISKESLFSSMFRSTKYTHYTQFEKIDGDFPFRPHRMLGFSPLLSLRVPFETDWSESVDIFKADFDAGEMTISVGTGAVSHNTSKRDQVNQNCHSCYEFGTYIERGKGFLQNITTVTIVPKHIIVSKLAIPIEIRQINTSETYTPLCLFPGTVQSYHFPVGGKEKLLQIRRYNADTSTNNSANLCEFSSDNTTTSDVAKYIWVGEIDICNLGIMYAKLRDPMVIIKVQVEIIGASLVTTLSQQSAKWPPYRIDNMTSNNIRFKQSITADLNQSLMSSSNNINNSHHKTYSPRKTSKGSQMTLDASLYTIQEEDQTSSSSSNTVPAVGTKVYSTEPVTAKNYNPSAPSAYFIDYDYVSDHSTGSFAWDLPISGSKLLKLEFQQGAQWISKDISLDDESRLEPIQIKTNLPSLGNPLAEGYLIHYNSLTDSWQKEYCILRPHVLYVYQDETRSTLTKLINMSNYNEQGVMQLACVFRYTDKIQWDLMNSIQSGMDFFGSVIGGIASTNKNNKQQVAEKSTQFDSNIVRVMILKIADFLGLLQNVSKDSHNNDSDEDEDRDSIEINSEFSIGEGDTLEDNQNSDVRLSVSKQSHKKVSKGRGIKPLNDYVSDDDDELNERVTLLGIAEIQDDYYLDNTKNELELAIGNTSKEDLAALVRTKSNHNLSSGALPPRDSSIVLVADDDNSVHRNNASSGGLSSTEGSSNASRAATPVGPSLIDLLKQGVSIEQLLEEASNIPVRVSDVVTALLGTNEVVNLDKASEICSWMITEGFLVARGARKAIDSSNPMDYSDDEHDPNDNNTEDSTSENEVDDKDSFRRTSFSVGGTKLHASMISDTNKEIITAQSIDTVTTRKGEKVTKKQDLLSEYHNVDLFLNPPTLNPELAAMLEADNLLHSGGGGGGHDMNTNRKSMSQSGLKSIAEEEIFGFTLMTNNETKYHFKCSSEMEFLGWIQACRQGIEMTWLEHEVGRKTAKDHLTLEHFQTSMILKLRADGPTKVLEIYEDIGVDDSLLTRANPTTRKNNLVIRGSGGSAKKPKLLPFSLKFDRIKSLNKSLLKNADEAEGADPESEQVLHVVFAVQSVALSLIDAEPAELLYLSLSGIEMSVERTVDTVKFSGTVHEIQLSNQLLNPDFPVALFPRRMKETLPADGIGHGRLMLPGLNQNRTTYPSLHIFLQQKYHQTITEISSTSNSVSYEQETKLRYFDMFTLWIAPVQLDVDEEIIVKVLRYVQDLRTAFFKSDLSDISNLLNEELMSLSQQTNKTWGSIDPRAVYEIYTQFLSLGKKPYLEYGKSSKNSSAVYFSLLQLHPLDIVMSFRPSPNLVVSNAELAIISIVSQLDCARLCLNALIAEHAFGTTSFIADILMKHYRAAFWRQFHKFIGASDLVEGSVGLVANLGTGVYDLFYEPIDGLLDQNGSFLDGLSKGGKSLASRAIGGTSGFTSKITGGIGKGVSLLTLDSEFQRNRSYRRFNKTSTVSEGLYVGTKELGKNVVEGVTGIVMSPYRGWETGGGVGFGLGVAKGILGVALKPAVGVFDLASRATEGIRNTAFNVDPDMMEERYGIHRKRIPRAFGRSGSVVIYNMRAAAAQYVADSLTNFKEEPRMNVIHHQHIQRKVVKTEVYTAMFLHNISISNYKVENNTIITDELEYSCKEAWGLPVDNNYLLLVCRDRVALVQMLPPSACIATKKNAKKPLNRKLIWSCPVHCIEQFYHDTRGDLVLSVNSSVCINGVWNASVPIVLDAYSQNFLIFQSLLEQTIGVRLARQQPLNPGSGLIQSNIHKRYSSGIRGLLMSPSRHTYRLFGNVLFEFTANKKNKNDASASTSGVASKSLIDVVTQVTAQVTAEEEQTVCALGEIASNSEEYINKIISKLFLSNNSVTSGNQINAFTAEQIQAEQLLNDTYLSFIYPLVDLYVVGPSPEDNGTKYSITLSRIDNTKMRTLRREEEGELFTEYQKISLSLIFTTFEHASLWRKSIESHIVFRVNDAIVASPLTTEEKKKSQRTLIRMSSTNEEVLEPLPNSVLGLLVIPTSGCKPEDTEGMKVQIAKTMTEVKQW